MKKFDNLIQGYPLKMYITIKKVQYPEIKVHYPEIKVQYIKTDNLSKNNVFLQKWVFTRFFKNNKQVF